MDIRVKPWSFLVVASLVLSGGCERPVPPNVLLITVDTLRSDALAAYGLRADHAPAVMPRTDSLMAEGVGLLRCYTVSPRTTQSFGSFMTGLYPTNHGAFGLFHTLPEEPTTLAERLSEAGYHTVAVVTNYFLRSDRGFTQGFDVYDDSLARDDEEEADRVAERVAHHVESGLREPFLLWVHWLDPHWPYEPPDSTLRLIEPSPHRTPLTVYDDIEAKRITRGSVIFQNVMTDDERWQMTARYDAEAMNVDRYVGRVVDLLASRGYMQNTLTVFYSDHGESMGEHDNYYAHGEDLYEESVRIPAFLHFPGRLEPRAMGGLVSSVDFFPTILDLCGLDGSEPLDGVSLLPALTGRADWPRTSCGIASDYQLIHPENPRFHRSGPAGKWRAVISGDHKLIHVPGSPDREWELYDVVTDPGETKNLVEMRPGLREELSAPMAEWEALIDRQSSHHADVDSEAARLLRSLGYIN